MDTSSASNQKEETENPLPEGTIDVPRTTVYIIVDIFLKIYILMLLLYVLSVYNNKLPLPNVMHTDRNGCKMWRNTNEACEPSTHRRENSNQLAKNQ